MSAVEIETDEVATDDAKIDAAILSPLLSIAKSMRALYGIKLAALGFHNGQDELLMIVNEEGIGVCQAADLLDVRPSTVSKMLDRLVAKGFVKRNGNGQDARRTLVRITSEGVRARILVVKARDELEKELAKALGDLAPSVSSSLGAFECSLRVQLRRIR